MGRDLSQFLEEVVLVAAEDDDGTRLDHFLADRMFWRSRTDIQARIRRGAILVNGAHAKPATRIRAGDRVTVRVTPADLPDQDPADVALDVLFEDDDLIAIDKRPGVVVHPTGRHVYDTIINALWLRFRKSGQLERGVRPEVVHRLDRNTSGVLVVAKRGEAKKALQRAFETREPVKEYLALVGRDALDERGVIDAPLGRDEDAEVRIRMTVRPDGGRSRTSWSVVERFEGHALLHARLHTGRQHQIRVHLAHLGHPIVCDPLYGDPRGIGLADPDAPAILDRQGLHAARLRLEHPTTRHPLDLEAPVPADMASLLEALRARRAIAHKADRQSHVWRSP